MIQKIQLRNPGCQFCRFYLAPFDYNREATRAACLKGARRIFNQKPKKQGLGRRWKWTDCSYSEEKNRTRHCDDFVVLPWYVPLWQKLYLYLMRAHKQHPPSYKKEIWWDT